MFCKHGAIDDLCIYCNPERGREHARRSRFIPKRELTELASAMIEFEKLSEQDKQWVRDEIERADTT
jgi:hypothetical protein